MKIPERCLHKHRVEQYDDYCKAGLIFITYGTTLTCMDCQKTYTYRSIMLNKHPINHIKSRRKERLYQDELPF